MIARRLLPALLAALLISGLFTLWLSRRLPKTSAAPATPMRRVVCVSRDIPAGDTLAANALQLSTWPAAQPLPGAFASPSDVAGRVLLYPVSVGEPILTHQLAAPGAGSGLGARIPDGMRAISVRADEVTGVAGFLLPGSAVDVLVTYRPATAPDFVTSTVLRNVRVLAIGQNSEPTPEAKPSTAAAVTLLVSPQNAEKLTLAASLGKIVFVLRNSTDHGEVANLSASAFGAAPAAEALRRNSPVRAPRTARATPAESFSVETVAGNKQREETFAGAGGK